MQETKYTHKQIILKPRQMIAQMCWNELIMKIKFRLKLSVKNINDFSKSILQIFSSLSTPSKISELVKYRNKKRPFKKIVPS